MSFCYNCGRYYQSLADRDNRRCRYCEEYSVRSRTTGEIVEILQFIHDRMIHVHNENRNADYMHALRDCIESLKPKITASNVDSTTGCVTGNYEARNAEFTEHAD